MGHRSWLTVVHSLQEWMDIWTRVGNLTQASNELMDMGVDKAAQFIKDHLNGQPPAMFDMDYVLVVDNQDAPFPKGSVVLAWSSDGDLTIKALPYYLRQQTEYLETFMAKYPSFHEASGPEKYGNLYHTVLTPSEVEEEGIALLHSARMKLEFLAGLPLRHLLDGEMIGENHLSEHDGTRTEQKFIEAMYYRLYDDPSGLGAANRSIFLSHNSADKDFVRKLASALESYGIRAWVDEAEIRVGESLIWKISDAIEECDFVAAILSKNSVESNWVKKELEMAMTEELAGDRYKVLPIILDDAKIPLFLRGKLYADFSDGSEWKRSVSSLVSSIHPGGTFTEMIENAGFKVQRNVVFASRPQKDTEE